MYVIVKKCNKIQINTNSNNKKKRNYNKIQQHTIKYKKG